MRARQRLLDTVAKEAASAPTLSQKTRKDGATGVVTPRKSWWGLLGWAATAAVLVFAASLWKENAALRSDLSTWRNVASQQELELGHAHDVVATLTSSDVQRVTLVSVKTPPQPQGKAFYLRNRTACYLSRTTCRHCRHRRLMSCG